MYKTETDYIILYYVIYINQMNFLQNYEYWQLINKLLTYCFMRTMKN